MRAGRWPAGQALRAALMVWGGEARAGDATARVLYDVNGGSGQGERW